MYVHAPGIKTLVIKNVEKLNISCNVGESVKWYKHSGNHYGDASKIETRDF